MVKAKQKPKQLPTTPGCGRRFSNRDTMWWTYSGALSKKTPRGRNNHWLEYLSPHAPFKCGRIPNSIYDAPTLCLDCARKMGVEW